jgi:hypothetical protein
MQPFPPKKEVDMPDLIKNPELVVNAEIKKNFEYVKIIDRDGKILRLILADEILMNRETELAGSQRNA